MDRSTDHRTDRSTDHRTDRSTDHRTDRRDHSMDRSGVPATAMRSVADASLAALVGQQADVAPSVMVSSRRLQVWHPSAGRAAPISWEAMLVRKHASPKSRAAGLGWRPRKVTRRRTDHKGLFHRYTCLAGSLVLESWLARSAIEKL